MLKALGVTLVVVGLLAWSAVCRATPSEERTAAAAPAGIQLARGGGSGRSSVLYAREKAAEKAEVKKEREAVDEAGKAPPGKNGSGDDTDASDAVDKDEAVGAPMGPIHHSAAH